jgi:hypothetical protein
VPAGSVYAAPVGTPLGSADWKLVGHTTDGVTMTETFKLGADRARLWFGESTPPPVPDLSAKVARMVSDAYLGNFRQRWAIGFDQKTFNERSKPMGLTKDHEYTDNEGDAIRVEAADPLDARDAVAFLNIKQVDDDEGFYVLPAFSIPLALNVLGYDRPSAAQFSFVAEVGNYTAGKTAPTGQYSRDALLAEAIASLRAVDAYDQRQVERKAKEDAKAKAEAEAAAKAKRDAEYARHKQESYERAKVTYADAIRDQIASGITPESVAKVQSALSAYETARRKLEGLPS